jgi:hypothetical protein
MENIYLALVDTPGIFAAMIRRVIGLDYIHVAIAMDKDLQETYSVGRRNPAIPFFAGFTRERADEILAAFPNARYKIVAIPCTSEQKESILLDLMNSYEHRKEIHYCILGLPFILGNKPFYQRNYFTCSSYLARLLSSHGLISFDKHFSLVTPKDFYRNYTEDVVYEGDLGNYIRSRNYPSESVRYET